MKKYMKYFNFHSVIRSAAAICTLIISIHTSANAQSFEGEKTSWRNGYDRYDFLMDTTTLAIKPIKAADSEQYGIAGDVAGQVRCVVVIPKKAAAGNPWLWRGFYWDHEPQSEVELLNRGYAIGYINCDPGRQWQAWYAFLTEKHGFAKRSAFGGMSRGANNAYTWATTHPDKVACIYGDNAAITPESLAKIGELAKMDIPLLSVCGNQDFLYEKNTLPIENTYLQLGGRITVLVKEGTAHHPHSLRNPMLIADWIVKSMQPAAAPPAFLSSGFVHSYYYDAKSSYNYLKEENTWMACRGPGYTPCYDRYDVKGKTRYGVSSAVIIMPNTPAPGKPWVLRADRIDRDALVDQALLAKGYAIVVTPLIDQSGAVAERWDEIYKLLTDNGFAKKPVLEGTGTNAGEAFAWAIANPDKVAGIYSVNPVMRSLMTKTNLLNTLAPLAKAGVPLFTVAGGTDPWLNENALELQKRYKALGGNNKVIIKKGEGHFIKPEPQSVIDLILAIK